MSTVPWSVRPASWPHSRERSLGSGPGPVARRSNRSSRHPPRRARPAAHWLCCGTAGFLLAGLPQCPAPGRPWRSGRGRLRSVRCRGGASARHGAAAAAAPPAAAALPRLAAPPGETPRRLPPPAEPLGRGVSPAAAWLGGGREGRHRGRWGGFSALLARRRFVGARWSHVGSLP